MSDTSLTYNAPGVYVDENASPVPEISSTVALPPTRVAIVGPANGYRTATEAVRLGALPVTLTERGIDTATVAVKSLDGVVHTVTTDYDVAQTGADPKESVTTVERVEGGAITLDDVVYVTYEFTDSSYYEPFLSGDWDEIQSRFGNAVDPVSGDIGSPLSLAAKILFEQQASEVVCVATEGSTPVAVTATQLRAGLAKLNSRDDIGVVVPLPIGLTGTDVAPGDTNTIGGDLANHVETASSQGQYRIGVIGLDKGADRDHASVAGLIESSRVMLAFPNVMNWYNGYTNRLVEISGSYLAVAYAGMMVRNAPQIPLTLKTVRSLGPIPPRVKSLMTPAFKNNLSSKGVAVAEERANGKIVLRHGVTTNVTSTLTSESSITRAKDALLRLVDTSLEGSGLVGQPITADTPLSIRSVVEGALGQAVSNGLVVETGNLAVRVSNNDQTVVEVKFSYRPAYPLNRITVSFSINTVTGTFTGEN